MPVTGARDQVRALCCKAGETQKSPKWRKWCTHFTTTKPMIRSIPKLAALLPALLLLTPCSLRAQAPVFETTTSYAGGVVGFAAQPGYFHRLWYNHGISNDGNGNATLLWTLLPEQVYGTGQNVAWRLHGDITPAAQGGGTPPPTSPLIMRSYHLRAYNDGGTLIQWWSLPLQRMLRAWTATPSCSAPARCSGGRSCARARR